MGWYLVYIYSIFLLNIFLKIVSEINVSFLLFLYFLKSQSIIDWKFYFLFIYFWPHSSACGILVLWLGTEPRSQQWNRQVVTAGLPGNSQDWKFLKLSFITHNLKSAGFKSVSSLLLLESLTPRMYSWREKS